MRTTIRLDETLLAAAKIAAAQSGRTLTAVIEDALRQALRSRQEPVRGRTRLKTVRGRGLRPGVSLDDGAALLDLMDEGHAAP
jgi:hypothetical protein